MRAELEPLPHSLTLPELPEFIFVHALARSEHDNISAYTPEATFEAMFPEPKSRFIVRGHDHVAATSLWSGTGHVTAGRRACR